MVNPPNQNDDKTENFDYERISEILNLENDWYLIPFDGKLNFFQKLKMASSNRKHWGLNYKKYPKLHKKTSYILLHISGISEIINKHGSDFQEKYIPIISERIQKTWPKYNKRLPTTDVGELKLATYYTSIPVRVENVLEREINTNELFGGDRINYIGDCVYMNIIIMKIINTSIKIDIKKQHILQPISQFIKETFDAKLELPNNYCDEYLGYRCQMYLQNNFKTEDEKKELSNHMELINCRWYINEMFLERYMNDVSQI